MINSPCNRSLKQKRFSQTWGLWDTACLSPHTNKRSVKTASQQQVRKKLYKGSSEAWRKYENQLNGLFAPLYSN